jgi:hypothetical protein
MRTLRVSLFILVLLEGAFMAPSFVLGHTGDVLLARLRLQNSREVVLEVTGDASANPLLRDSPNPALAMGQSLRVLLPSGRSWNLTELGKPAVTLRDGFNAPAPVSVQHPDGEPLPELTTVTWHWRPSETPLRLEVPESSKANVLFWSTPPDSEAVAAGWAMLLPGDRTPPLPLPLKPSLIQWNWQAIACVTIAAAGLLLQFRLLLSRLKRPFAPPKSAPK